MARQNLLIVDGDPRTRRVLEVSLRKAGYSITAAESMAQALQFLELTDPELIVSDTRLPDGDGFEFCRLVKSHSRWGGIPFIFLTNATELEEKIRGLELGVDDYLTKPIYVKEVTIRVKMLLQRKQQERIGKKDARTKFSGLLADMAIVDLFQTIEISRKSGTIEFETDLGAATVWFRDGKVIDAQMGRLQAAAAVYRLLGLSEGRFEVEFKTISRAATIEDATQTLLMEGMRRIDEWGRLLEGLPPLDHVLTIDPQATSAREESPQQVDLLRRFNGRRSIIEVIDDSGLDDLAALEQIGALYFEGVLTEMHESSPAEPPTPDSSGDHLEDWNLAHPAVKGFRIPRTIVSIASREPAADLPPLPAFPQPFPGGGGGDGEDVLVGGIPDDSQNGAIDPHEIVSASHVARVPQTIASPLGASRAEAFGEVSTDNDAPVSRPHPSSSVIVRLRPASDSFAGASHSAVESRPLLAESEEDMGRLNALVAQALAANAAATQPPVPAKVEVLAEEVRDPDEVRVAPASKWQWAVGFMVLAALVVYWSRMQASRAPSTPPPAKAEVTKAEVTKAEVTKPDVVETKVPPAEPVEPKPEPEVRPPEPPPPEPLADAEITPPQRKRMEQAERSYRTGKLKEASAELEALRDEVPGSAEVLVLLANVRIDQGRLAEAKAAAEAAIEIDASLADAHLVLGVIRQEQDEVAGAIAAYERYLELAPKARYATTVRAQLRSLQRKAAAP